MNMQKQVINKANKNSKVMTKVLSTSEFLKESKTSYTLDEIKKDVEEVRNAYTKAEKQAIASKYGIASNKIQEIEKGIYQIANNQHKVKKPSEYTNEDFMFWWHCFDAPTSTQALKKALEGESVDWVKFVAQKAKELIFKGKRGDYWDRAQRSFEKYTTGLINDENNSKDESLKNLIAKLTEETTEFHDRHIDEVRKWADDYCEFHKQFKTFDIWDFMSYFGTEDRERVADTYESQYNQMYGRWAVEKKFKCEAGWFSPFSEEYTSKKGHGVVKWGNEKLKPKPVRIPLANRRDTLGKDDKDRTQYSDVPSQTVRKLYKDNRVFASAWHWNKEKFVNYEVDMAEAKYKSDIKAIAFKVRRMKMDEANIYVRLVMSDPLHLDIYISDGKKDVHARSIFAAEHSVLVTPHYRFIIT